MDDLLDQVRDMVEGQIDFEGQKLAQLINYAFLSTFGVLSFLAGYFTGNVYNAVWVGLAGAVITMLAVVPPWPFYNQKPVTWLPSRKVGGMWVDFDQKSS